MEVGNSDTLQNSAESARSVTADSSSDGLADSQLKMNASSSSLMNPPTGAAAAAVRAFGKKMISESALLVQAMKGRIDKAESALEVAHTTIKEKEKMIKLLKKQTSDANEKAKALSEDKAALEKDKIEISKSAKKEGAKLKKEIEKANRQLEEVKADRDKLMSEHQAIDEEEEVRGVQSSNEEHIIEDNTEENTEFLEVPGTPAKRPHSELEEGDIITVQNSRYEVSPATNGNRIVSVGKVFSTNPINIKMIENHGAFVVLEYDPTDLKVAWHQQPPVSLHKWTLSLHQADLKTGENAKSTSFHFADDLTLSPGKSVTIWQTQILCDENGAPDEYHYEIVWPGMKIAPNSQYELSLMDSEGVIASSCCYPPVCAVGNAGAFRSPKRPKLDETKSPVSGDEATPSIDEIVNSNENENGSCAVM